MMGLPIPSSPNLISWSSLFVIKSLDKRYHITLIRPKSDPEILDILDPYEGRGRELTDRITFQAEPPDPRLNGFTQVAQ